MAKTFKDFLQQDVSNVFFNIDEMSDEHELEGRTLNIIVDESNLEGMRGYGKDQLSASQELYVHFITIFVKISDFYVPKVGSQLRLDNQYYYVEESYDESGIVKIVLSANEV